MPGLMEDLVWENGYWFAGGFFAGLSNGFVFSEDILGRESDMNMNSLAALFGLMHFGFFDSIEYMAAEGDFHSRLIEAGSNDPGFVAGYGLGIYTGRKAASNYSGGGLKGAYEDLGVEDIYEDIYEN